MKCSNFDETCDCPACEDDRKKRRIERARHMWSVRQVIRADAGGLLYAPVDLNGGESGHTPSYDDVAIQRLCNQLNAREVALAERS